MKNPPSSITVSSLACISLICLVLSAKADVIINGPGNIVIAEEGGIIAAGNLSSGQPSFALDLINAGGYPAHQIPHLSDGVFGNNNSWIGASAGSYCGVSLGATPATVASVAFGRDNTGAFPGRWQSLYTLRFTQVANPDETTGVTGDASTGWQDIGTLDYGAGVPGTLYSQPPLRHRYNFDPVSATGLRIDTAADGTCIDEIEIYATAGAIQPPLPVVDLTPAAGFDITYDGNDGDYFNGDAPPSGAMAPTNLALSGFAFGSGELQPGGTHQILRVNDGFYGNSNSWIPGAADAIPYIGIDLDGEKSVVAVAWGRDNGNLVEGACSGQCADRNAGVYTVQITNDADPTTSTNWTSVGTIGYSQVVDTTIGGGFTPWFRHQFGITNDVGDPLTITGLRILVPDNDICIDELEIISSTAIPELIPIQEGGSSEVGNLATAGSAFAKDSLGGRSPGSLNDETYGDASAWVGGTADSFSGIALAAETAVASIAFGRDNTGTLSDRTLGTYLLQYTNVVSVDETTPDGDWTTIGAIELASGNPQNPSLRHRFNFTSVSATGFRLMTPDGAAIDEFEIYTDVYTPPLPPALVITPESGFDVTWDGNDGDFFDENPPPGGAVVPDNLALPANGGTAFASSELGPEISIGYHLISNLNDGLYGNSNSWISASADPGPQAFAGISFGELTSIESIAWSRDNSIEAVNDRALGIYTLQITTVPNPNADTLAGDWTTVATINYVQRRDTLVGEDFTEYLRHQFDLLQNGSPILATGIRLLVPQFGIAGGTAIDELEIYGSSVEVPFRITDFDYNEATGESIITFNSQPNTLYLLQASTTMQGGFSPGSWLELGDFTSVGTTTTVCVIPLGGTSSCPPAFTIGEYEEYAGPFQFFRIRKSN